MARTSPVHYIAPSAISVIPNANGSANDLAVSITRGARIRVYSPKVEGLDMEDATFQEWTLAGRNRRLSDNTKPYTIYARLRKADKTKGYLIFAPKEQDGQAWKDKYAYVTWQGLAAGTADRNDSDYWYIRLGDVSLPDDGERTVTMDTGILGTDQYNTQWNFDPDDMPLRIELDCTIDSEDAGPTPYVPWDKALLLHARLVEGWADTSIERFDHWTIIRNTGAEEADAEWNEAHSHSVTFAETGNILLQHHRSEGDDDFDTAVSSTFTVTAWGTAGSDSSSSEEDIPSADTDTDNTSSSSSASGSSSSDGDSSSSSDGEGDIYVPLAVASVTIMAETVERYELVLSETIASYNPLTGEYRPAEGITVTVRATDQKTSVYRISKAQLDVARLQVSYAPVGTGGWTPLAFTAATDGTAQATIPAQVFRMQKSLNVRLADAQDRELDVKAIAFLLGGEDTADREWIFLRSETATAFSDDASAPIAQRLPSLITGGEVKPEGAAGGEDTDSSQDGWVPEGWYDNMQGVDDTWRYEYASFRDYIRDTQPSDSSSSDEPSAAGHWGEFSAPSLWDRYSADGATYRCRWTLGGKEIWQLPAPDGEAFQGELPLVGTLMKRTGSSGEEPVEATATLITVGCEGLGRTFAVSTVNPELTVSDDDNPEILACLSDKALTGLSVTFAPDGDAFQFLLPVAGTYGDTESDVEHYGSEYFLSKTHDDEANGVIGFLKGVWFGVKNWFIDALGNARLNDVEVDGLLTSLRARIDEIRSSNYSGSGIFESGWTITNSHNGHSYMEIDELLVRMKATFMELEIRKETYSGGNVFYSPAGSRVYRVEYYDENNNQLGVIETEVVVPWTWGGKMLMLQKLTSKLGIFSRKKIITVQSPDEIDMDEVAYFRCYLLADDGTTQTRNWWHVNDLARCQTFNRAKNKTQASGSDAPVIEYDESYKPVDMSQMDGNKFYWRMVIGTGSKRLNDGKWYDYIDLSNESSADDDFYVSGSDIPAVGDAVVCVGNRTDAERMNVIMLEVIGSDAPAIKIYRGINSFSMDGRKYMQLSPKKIQFRTGSIEYITDYGEVVPPKVHLGVWNDSRRYHYYEEVSYNGSTWLCRKSDGNHWEDAESNRYESFDVSEIVFGDGSFEYTFERDGVEKSGTDRYTERGTSNGTTVYYIRNYTTDEPTESSDVWEKETSAGGDGQKGSYKSTAFCRTNVDIKDLVPTGGSYNNAVPTSIKRNGAEVLDGGRPIVWEDGLPDGEKTLWSSTCTFYGNNSSSGWSPIRKAMDSENYDVEFALEQQGGAEPAAPTDANRHGGSGTQIWFDPILDNGNLPSGKSWSDMVWRAEREKVNGVFGQWVITRIKGEKGDPGTIDDETIERIEEDLLDLISAGYTITMNPQTLFLSQDTSGQVSFANAKTEIKIYNGDEEASFAFSGHAAYGYSPSDVKTRMTGCSSAVYDSDSKTGTVSLTGIDYTTKDNGGVTEYDYAYDHGTVDFGVVLGSKTYGLSVSWYLNRLGERILKVYGDFEGQYMSRTEYSQVDAKNLLVETVSPSDTYWSSGSRGAGIEGLRSYGDVSDSPAVGFSKSFRIKSNGTGKYTFWRQLGGYWSKTQAYRFTAYVRNAGSSGTVKARISVYDGTEQFSWDKTVGTSWTAINVPFVLTGEAPLGSNVYFEIGIDGEGDIEYIAPFLSYSDYGVIRTEYKGLIESSASGLRTEFERDVEGMERDISSLEQTAEGLTSTVEKVSKSIGKNLFDCADGYGWTAYYPDETIHTNRSAQEIYIRTSGESDVVSSSVYLTKGNTYVLSVYASSKPWFYCQYLGFDPNAAYNDDTDEDDIEISTNPSVLSGDVYNTFKRYYASFTPSSTGYYKFDLCNASIYYRPMLEYGENPSEWDAGATAYRSDIKQTADSISLSVSRINSGLSRTGIDIENGKISMQADDFVLTNNSGAQTMGVDEQGNIMLTGTVKAKNLYHGVCLVTEGGIYSNSWYYFKRTPSLDDTYDPFVSGSFYTAAQIREMTDGVISNPAGDTSGAFTRCTYDADIVIIIPEGNSTGTGGGHVYLPYPVIFDGKMVTVYNRSTQNNTIHTVNGESSIVGIIYYSGGYTDNTPDNKRTISGRTCMTFYSMYVGSRPRWVVIEERDI